MRKLLVLAMLSGLALAAPSAAGAADGVHQLRAEFVTVSMPPGPPIGAPAGFEDGWATGSVGTGNITSPVYSGPVTVVETHFSRFLAADLSRPTGVNTAKVGGGVLTFTVPGDPESSLVLAFVGTFQLSGDISDPFGFDTHIVLRTEIVAGSGVFAGATGSGHVTITGNVIESAELVGSYVAR